MGEIGSEESYQRYIKKYNLIYYYRRIPMNPDWLSGTPRGPYRNYKVVIRVNNRNLIYYYTQLTHEQNWPPTIGEILRDLLFNTYEKIYYVQTLHGIFCRIHKHLNNNKETTIGEMYTYYNNIGRQFTNLLTKGQMLELKKISTMDW